MNTTAPDNSPSQSHTPLTLLYVMDPHCGWCYGFGKVIGQLAHHYQNHHNLRFEILPGGLFVPAIKSTPSFADDKRPAIKRIEELSGAIFSEAYISGILGGSILDSEVPCRVLNTAKQLIPDQIIPFMEDLFDAQFVGAKNISLFENCLSTIEKYGIDVDRFQQVFDSPELKSITQTNFDLSHRITTGYPALFIIDSDGHLHKLTNGFAPFERVAKAVEEWVEFK